MGGGGGGGVQTKKPYKGWGRRGVDIPWNNTSVEYMLCTSQEYLNFSMNR